MTMDGDPAAVNGMGNDGCAAAPASRTVHLGPENGSAELVLPVGLQSSDVDAICELTCWCMQSMCGVAEAFNVPLPRLEIWMLDLTESLAALAPRVKGPPVIPGDVERMGGQLAGKTMPLEEDWSKAALASPGVMLASDDGREKALAMFNLLHEVGHTVIERLGVLSGVRETGWHPTNHSRRKAENAVRHGLDEWRVSSLAWGLLRSVIRTQEGQDVTALDLFGAGYRVGLRGVLERVYPGWPDAVQRYRVHQLSLEDMYAQIVGETVEVFTILSHVEAESVMLERVTPLRDEYATHPATRLYLGEPWRALIDCDAPLLAPLPDFAEAEGVYLSDVAPKVIDMWRRLGVTFTDGPGRWDLRIDVGEPLWDVSA